jgi:hypothetical protein
MSGIGRPVLTLIYLPVALGVKSHLKKAILGIVFLAAAGAGEITTPGRSAMIIVLGDGESCAAAARDEKHAEGPAPGLGLRTCAGRQCAFFRAACLRRLGFHVRISGFLDCRKSALLSPVGLKHFLSQTERLGSDFDELIVGDEFDRLLQI